MWLAGPDLLLLLEVESAWVFQSDVVSSFVSQSFFQTSVLQQDVSAVVGRWTLLISSCMGSVLISFEVHHQLVFRLACPEPFGGPCRYFAKRLRLNHASSEL